MISFVIVAFNNTRSLRTCLSSIVDQTVPLDQIEILVMDNSTDPVAALENSNLCLWRTDKLVQYHWVSDRTEIDLPEINHKRCLYTATEIGIELSKGEWIVTPNADSYYTPVFAERMISVAIKKDWELIYSDFILGGPHIAYSPRAAAPRNCEVDKTCVMFKKSWFEGYTHKHSHYGIADGLFIEDLVSRGIRHGRMDEILVVHN